jgi:hypothetical protein
VCSVYLIVSSYPCFEYDQVTELASHVDVSYHPCLSKQSIFIVIFPLRLFVIGIAGEQAAFLYRRGRLALYPRQNISRHGIKESVAIFLSIYDCVFIKLKCVYGKMGLSYQLHLAFRTPPPLLSRLSALCCANQQSVVTGRTPGC